MARKILYRPPQNLSSEVTAPKKRSRIAGPVLFWVVIGAAILAMSVVFRVRVIEVEGNEHYTDLEIIQAVDIEEGDNLFFYDRFQAVSNVFSKLPYVDEVSIARALPNKVTIHVVESKAIAYIQVGDEQWTINENCKVLGKAAPGEDEILIPVEGFNPGTLLIGEQLTISNGKEEPVEYLAAILDQIRERGLAEDVKSIDFSDSRNVNFTYRGKYTVKLGSFRDVEYKFGLFLAADAQLLPGDNGILDISDGVTVHFSPI